MEQQRLKFSTSRTLNAIEGVADGCITLDQVLDVGFGLSPRDFVYCYVTPACGVIVAPLDISRITMVTSGMLTRRGVMTLFPEEGYCG